MCVCVCVCVCVCESEIECMFVSVRQCLILSVCGYEVVRGLVGGWLLKQNSVCIFECETVSISICVCVCERER